MDRKRFLKKLIRYVLLAFLAWIALLTGRKVSRASACTTCPGAGICYGKSDCSKYLLR